uniref:Putative ribonuclease H-like domain-containing protein n=1 Tax=Tanacetum cinerariifolium TaxID=118510 RepID=A0A6L2NX76_TANCI|nr:putative ribonuclease H-like domain-containing protein [Tanacetum cinerariifolium]
MEKQVAEKPPKETILENEIDRILEVSLTCEIRDCMLLSVEQQKNELLKDELEKSLSVKSSNSVRRPKSKDTKLKNRVLKNTKSSYTYVWKTSSSDSIDSNKCEPKDSNVCQINTCVSNSKIVNVVNDGLNIVCISYGKDVFLHSHEKCVARYALSRNSSVKSSLFHSLVAAKFKNLGATSVVAKSRLTATKTLTATNKIKLKANIGIINGYSDSSRRFRIYNRRTKKIMETIHVKFDELTTMASECNNFELGTNCPNFQELSKDSQLVPSKSDLDNLFGPFLSPEWNTNVVVLRNKVDMDTISMNDLYNNLNVYEPEVKRMSSSSSSTQNMAFMSSSNNNTSSTNGAVNIAQAVNTTHGVSTACTQMKDMLLLEGTPKEEKLQKRVPRKNNMYSVDLKNIVPKGGLTCPFSKGTSDESKLWHRRIENLVDHKVKVIRCDNGTEFKNKEMNQFYEMNDQLGKFNGKADEGSFIGYSLNIKAFRVFNIRTRIVEENLHIRFSESTPNVVGSRPDCLFDIDSLTKTMIYEPIVACTRSNGFADPKSSNDDGSKPSCDDGKKVDEDPRKENECNDQEKEDNVNNTNNVNTVSSTVNTAGTNEVNTVDDEDDGAVADMNNLDTKIQVSPIPTIKIHKDHPLNQVIGYLQSATQTRKMSKNLQEHGFVSTIQQRTNHKDLQNCLFACFLSQEEPKKIEEKVYVCQPIGFEDPNFIDRVYKVKKALYGLHQAPRAWFTEVKTISTPMETQKPLLKDEYGEVDVHMYRSMIGLLMYLTSLRSDIMFSVCACARYQVNLKVSHFHAVKRIFRLVRVATTAFSLEAEQESGKITKTQSKETHNEPSSQETDSSGGPRCQETMGDIILQTRFERVSKQSNDLLLAKGGSRSLKKKNSSRTHKLKRLYKVSLCTKVESSGDEESLGEDASKQERRIDTIDADEEITLVSAQDEVASNDADKEMFNVNVLGGKEVFVAGKNENVVEEVVDAAQVNTTMTTVTITIEEITLAQALEALNTSKPRVKGIVFQESEKDSLFQQLLERKRKHFAAKRTEEKRNKPPTKAQQRKIMCTYLKNMEGYKPKDLNLKEFDSIQEMFDGAFKRQKVEDEKEKAELKQLMETIPDEKEVTIDAIYLAIKSPRIVNWKIHKEGKKDIIKKKNLVDHKVKVIRCDNRTEFKNREMNQFCEMKGILRQFSVARTPQQNVVATRRNMTLIEAARTMLADSKLPTFWAEAVNIACYVQDKVLVVKPHNKTPYEIFHDRTPILSFMRPFGYPVTILNTIDHLGSEPDWLFDINALTRTINYEPIIVGTQFNSFADPKSSHNDGSKPLCDDGKKVDEDPRKENECNDQEKEDNVNSTNNVNTVSSTVNTVGTSEDNELPFDPNMPALEDVSIFNFLNDDEDDSIVADMNNLDTTIQLNPILTTRIHKDHPLDQMIGDLQSTIQTRKMSNNLEEHGFELGDRLVRAATTASSLEAKQDGGNITKTQSKATPNESSFQRTDSSGGLRDNTLRSDEDRLILNELMALCTNLQTRVLELEKTKITQHNKIASLKKRVKKIEKRNRSRTHKLKRLYKVGLSARVESSDNKESLDDDASKQERRIDAIDADEEITLINAQDDAEMFDVDDLGGEKVFVARKNDNVVEEVVNAAQVSTAATTVQITTKEITLAQALEALKTSKPKVKGIVFQEPGKSTTTTTTTIPKQQSQNKEKKKHFAAKIAEEKRNKPPTKAQQRKIMCTYLKNMKGYKLKDLKLKEFDSIQEMFDRAFRRVNTFEDFRPKLVEGKGKRA